MSPLNTIKKNIENKTVRRSSKDYLRDFYQVCRNRKYVWSIGIYTGKTPLTLAPSKHVANPVLTAEDVTDANAEFVADPFMIRANERWHMFFEVLDKADDLGKIGLATSADGHTWTYERLVLEEPFHLSYPYVFQWKNDYYMVPETYQANDVRLYKAVNFPYDWALESTLIKNESYVDSSLCYFNGYWWLFTASVTMDTLYLYYSKTLTGGWQQHPQNPLITNNKGTARPGGRVVTEGNRLIRYAQDDVRVYGEKVRAFEVTDISPTTYAEKEVSQSPVLSPGDSGWNAVGMHTVDPHIMPFEYSDRHNSNTRADPEQESWIACVDGVQAQSVSQWLRTL